jgi:carbon monoxide dehydrogenase subunit G
MRTFPNSFTGGRANARRLLVAAAVSLCVALPGAQLAATADPGLESQVTVREDRGVYSVAAEFLVPQPPAAALAVLSDYEQIPRFMPDVQRSVVLERTPGRLIVEQEAVSRLMMFSKKVHLVLEVTEDRNTLRFRDRCLKSFTSYEGSWQAVERDGGAAVSYKLTATPAFDVPEFILRRLLKRDSTRMIEGLKREIASRAVR